MAKTKEENLGERRKRIPICDGKCVCEREGGERKRESEREREKR
jgi:hypothetical protein